MNTIKRVLLEAIEDTLQNDVCDSQLKEKGEYEAVLAQLTAAIEDVAKQNPWLESVLDVDAEPTIIKLEY